MKPLLATPLLALLVTPATHAADTLYAGGPVITINQAQPQAEAVVVRDGRIAFVGSRQAAMQFSPQARVVDLQGHTLAPGFIDAHSHVSGTGL